MHKSSSFHLYDTLIYPLERKTFAAHIIFSEISSVTNTSQFHAKIGISYLLDALEHDHDDD